MKKKPVAKPLTITGTELRQMRRDLRNARIAAKAALALFRTMEMQGALRLPFPGLDEVIKALKILVGDA